MSPARPLVEAVVAAAAGLGLGLAFWGALRPMLRLYLARAVLPALGLLLVRVALLAGLFGVAAGRGPWPLLGALAGLLLARHLTIRRVAGEP